MKTVDGQKKNKKVVIIGGGPSGLTAAYELTRYQLQPIVLEKLDKVGGIARTEKFKDFYFDMGGHRFFTKSERVNNFWREVLKDDFLLRPRLSRIYYHRKFFDYPLKPFNALRGLGLLQSIMVGLSYLRSQFFPKQSEDTFEEWVTNRFGQRLFNIFFKSYTEKVWGIPTSELSSEWAAQRIKDLDLKTAVINMFVKSEDTIQTLIEEFHYPRYGPGMLWNNVKTGIEARGGQVHLNTEVCGILHSGNRIDGVIVSDGDQRSVIEGTDFISSMPITEFVQKLDPPAPQHVLEAASQLSYRDFLTVCLIVNGDHLFEDNWIYVHDSDVKVGRIQNFKNWSPDMVPDASKTSLGLEYFCNQGDELWNSPDVDLIELGKREIEHIGLAKYQDVDDGCVFRVEKSYPVYDSTYTTHLNVLREFVENLENFQTIGRNGLHRYNNQDHAMLTGMLAVNNLLFDDQFDLWQVNVDQEYHEEIREPKPRLAYAIDEAFARAFMKIDPTAFGLSLGTTMGLLLWLMTNAVAAIQSREWIRMLYLLNQYFPGYDVNFTGSFMGLFYGFLVGFLIGWGAMFLRNTTIRLYIAYLQRRAEIQLLEKMGVLPDDPSGSPGRPRQGK